MDNLKLMKPSNLDQYQMDNMSFDAEKGAWRMTIVDGLTLKADSINLPEQKTVEVPVIVKEPEIHQINVPVIVKEFEKVEVPVVIKEVEYKIVEVPVTVTEVKVVEIEKPIIVTKTEYKELPLFLKICIYLQALGTIGMFLTHILKG